MVDDVLLNKSASLERCIKRVREEYVGHEKELKTNYTKQDAIILNIQRACETAIDAAMYLVKKMKLGLPQNSRETFVLLEQAGFLSSEISIHLQSMTGFRNIAIHEYTKLNIDIIESIILHRLDDFTQFASLLIQKA